MGYYYATNHNEDVILKFWNPLPRKVLIQHRSDLKAITAQEAQVLGSNDGRYWHWTHCGLFQNKLKIKYSKVHMVYQRKQGLKT